MQFVNLCSNAKSLIADTNPVVTSFLQGNRLGNQFRVCTLFRYVLNLVSVYQNSNLDQGVERSTEFTPIVLRPVLNKKPQLESRLRSPLNLPLLIMSSLPSLIRLCNWSFSEWEESYWKSLRERNVGLMYSFLFNFSSRTCKNLQYTMRDPEEDDTKAWRSLSQPNVYRVFYQDQVTASAKEH